MTGTKKTINSASYHFSSPARRAIFCHLLPIALLVGSVAAAATTALLDRFSLDADSMMQWRLPDRLNEISGLAITSDGRLLAVDDEVAVIYELNYDDGHLVKAFALGNPVIKGDFEGIAVADDLVYITTSAGRVFVSAEGADGQRVTFDNFDTGLGNYCEIEGLVQSTDNSRLYFMCKKARKKSGIKGLTLIAWDIAGRQMLPDESIVLPEKEIFKKLSAINQSPVSLNAVNPSIFIRSVIIPVLGNLEIANLPKFKYSFPESVVTIPSLLTNS